MKRKYLNAGEVAIGDKVHSFNGAFATSIVERIEETAFDKLVHLARPIMRADATGGAWIYVERYSAYMSQFLSAFEVYVTGASGNKDNSVF